MIIPDWAARLFYCSLIPAILLLLWLAGVPVFYLAQAVGVVLIALAVVYAVREYDWLERG